MTLPITGLSGLGDLLAAYEPRVVVIAGGEEQDDDVARWAYRVRASAGALPVMLFHRGGRERTRTTGARHLEGSPTLAADQLVDLAEGGAQAGIEEALEFHDVPAPVPVPVARRRRMTA
jgi:hypothetical protein